MPWVFLRNENEYAFDGLVSKCVLFPSRGSKVKVVTYINHLL